MMERSALADAKQAAMHAAMLHQQARRAQPLIGPFPPLQIAQGNMMSDVFFDNPWSDMHFHRRIEAR